MFHFVYSLTGSFDDWKCWSENQLIVICGHACTLIVMFVDMYVCIHTYSMYVLIVCFLYVTENNIYMEEVVSWRFRTRGPNIWISVWT